MRSRVITIAGFVLLALTGAVMEWAARTQRARVAPFGQVLSELMRTPPVRIAVLFTWWWIGWHFFTR